MTSGSIPKQMVFFALPILLGNLFQQLYNTVDSLIVGNFLGSQALAAVSSSGNIIFLMIGFFNGVAIGAGVVISRYFGAREIERMQNAIHTTVAFGLIVSFIMTLIGVFFTPTLLRWMGTPDSVMAASVTYFKIYFLGSFGSIMYNFFVGILQAVGDSKHSLYYLIVSSVVNIVLDLFFIAVLKMGVGSAALATIISEGISSALILLCLKHMDGPLHFELKDMRFHKELALQMLEVGLPAGLQGIIFSISNVLIQSSINSFGSLVMAGNTAASNIEGFVYTSMNAVYQTSLSFTSQNFGAKKYNRIDKILLECLVIVSIVGLVLGQGAYFFGQQLLSIYSSDERVIQFGINRLAVISTMYCLCGIMDTLVGSLRGIGYSILPMLVSLTGVCLIRVIWIFTVFKAVHTTFSLYISYPITWVITLVAHGICFMVVRKKIRRVA